MSAPRSLESQEVVPTPEEKAAASSQKARRELASAEAKISDGVTRLYNTFNNPNTLSYDAQGIAAIELKPSDPRLTDEIKALFPNGLKNGITLSFYRDGFYPASPITLLIREQIKGLCLTAKNFNFVSPTMADAIQDFMLITMQGKTQEIIDEANKKTSAEEKANTVNELTQKAIKEAANTTLAQLYEQHTIYKQKEDITQDDFSKTIIKASQFTRSDTTDILTFNAATNVFTYEEAAHVTAHDKRKGRSASNLAFTSAGIIKPSSPPDPEEKTEANFQCIVKSSYFKNASLSTGKHGDSDIEDIIYTYLHAEEIALEQAKIRYFGRTPEEQKEPMEIDWTYQLLTTNALNLDKQRSAYITATKAIRLLDSTTLSFNFNGEEEIPVSVRASVMNAGINWASNFDPNITSTNENRRAYIHLTEAVAGISFNITKSQEEYYRQYYRSHNITSSFAKTPDKCYDHAQQAISVLNQSVQSALKIKPASEIPFSSLAHRYAECKLEISETKKAIKRLEKTKETSNPKEIKEFFDPQIERYNSQLESKKSELILLSTTIKEELNITEVHYRNIDEQTIALESEAKKVWQKNRFEITTAIAFLKGINAAEHFSAMIADPACPQEEKIATEELLKNITACILKSYLDDLYYSDQYRYPEKAAVFHAYEANLQRLIGISTSIGCKSANDRTYLVRLLTDLLAIDSSPLPEIVHTRPLSETQLNRRAGENAMSHAAMLSCIADNRGDPKFKDKFPFLVIPFGKLIGKIGSQFSAHKFVPDSTYTLPDSAPKKASRVSSLGLFRERAQTMAAPAPAATVPAATVPAATVPAADAPKPRTLGGKDRR